MKKNIKNLIVPRISATDFYKLCYFNVRKIKKKLNENHLSQNFLQPSKYGI